MNIKDSEPKGGMPLFKTWIQHKMYRLFSLLKGEKKGTVHFGCQNMFLKMGNALCSYCNSRHTHKPQFPKIFFNFAYPLVSEKLKCSVDCHGAEINGKSLKKWNYCRRGHFTHGRSLKNFYF